MVDYQITEERIGELQDQMDICRNWLNQCLYEPYTVAEITATIVCYLDSHLTYFFNIPNQDPEKEKRIYKVVDLFNAEHFKRTRDFSVKLAASSDKTAFILAEIAHYEHGFLYYMNGRYYNIVADGKGFECIIPHAISPLQEQRQPYFEWVFDENFNFNPNGAEFFSMLSEAYYLEWLRKILINFKNIQKKRLGYESVNPVGEAALNHTSRFIKFEDLFNNQSDIQLLIQVMNEMLLLGKGEQFAPLRQNKKTLAGLILVLRENGVMKWEASFKDIARLFKDRFKINTLDDSTLRRPPHKKSEEMADIRSHWQSKC